MVKTFTKQRTVEYQENDIVCDLCEKEIKKGNPFLTIQPNVAASNGNRYPNAKADRNLDVCSTECLLKNVGAAAILMNTKHLPSVKEDFDKNEDARKSLDEAFKQFDQAEKYVKTTPAFPQTYPGVYPGKMDITWTSTPTITCDAKNSADGI